MKESLKNLDKYCIFRETFNSNTDTIRNGGNLKTGTISNGIITFSTIISGGDVNGILYAPSSTARAIPNPAQAWSIRMIFTTPSDLTTAGATTFYSNGVSWGTGAAGSLSDITTTNELAIGNRSTSADRTFDGYISGVKIIAGVLTSNQVTTLYNSTKRYYE